MASLSNDIASIGVNFYFDEMADWYRELEWVLSKHKCVPEPMPDIHCDKGNAFVEYSGQSTGTIYFSWHRMNSGRFEVVCYKC